MLPPRGTAVGAMIVAPFWFDSQDGAVAVSIPKIAVFAYIEL